MKIWNSLFGKKKSKGCSQKIFCACNQFYDQKKMCFNSIENKTICKNTQNYYYTNRNYSKKHSKNNYGINSTGIQRSGTCTKKCIHLVHNFFGCNLHFKNNKGKLNHYNRKILKDVNIENIKTTCHHKFNKYKCIDKVGPKIDKSCNKCQCQCMLSTEPQKKSPKLLKNEYKINNPTKTINDDANSSGTCPDYSPVQKERRPLCSLKEIGADIFKEKSSRIVDSSRANALKVPGLEVKNYPNTFHKSEENVQNILNTGKGINFVSGDRKGIANLDLNSEGNRLKCLKFPPKFTSTTETTKLRPSVATDAPKTLYTPKENDTISNISHGLESDNASGTFVRNSLVGLRREHRQSLLQGKISLIFIKLDNINEKIRKLNSETNGGSKIKMCIAGDNRGSKNTLKFIKLNDIVSIHSSMNLKPFKNENNKSVNAGSRNQCVFVGALNNNNKVFRNKRTGHTLKHVSPQNAFEIGDYIVGNNSIPDKYIHPKILKEDPKRTNSFHFQHWRRRMSEELKISESDAATANMSNKAIVVK